MRPRLLPRILIGKQALVQLLDTFSRQNHEVCAVPTSVDRFKLRREKDGQKEVSNFTRPEKRPETQGAGRARGHASREARLYRQRTSDSKKLTRTQHEKNQAEQPMRLGVNSKESGRSRTKLARTPEGTRASNERSEPVPCGKRCRRCSTLKEKWVSKRRTQSAGVQVANSKFTESRMRCSSTKTSCF